MAKSKGYDLLDKKTKLPFPDEKFFMNPQVDKTKKIKKKSKYDSAYIPYVKWRATPKQIREPKTQVEFEKRWKLPRDRVCQMFQRRPDFHSKKMTYFWNWVFDKYPDVIYAVYQRALNKSTADARIFADLVNKRLEVDAPKPQMTPFMLVGVPQEKINALFTPEGYEKAKDIEEAEVVDE